MTNEPRRMHRRAGVVAALALAGFSVALGAPAAHADSMDWDALAACESGGNWSADTGNGAYGGLQIKPATWAANGGSGSPAWAPRSEQIRVAENVLRAQGPGAWPKCGGGGGTPTLWSLPATTTAAVPAAVPACGSIRPGAVLGLLDLRSLCSTLLAPGRR